MMPLNLDQELKDVLVRVINPNDGEVPQQVIEALQHVGIFTWKHFAYFGVEENALTKQGEQGIQVPIALWYR